MDYYQRKMLEIEVEAHRVRIRELIDELRDLEDNLGDIVDAPLEILRQADRLRLELKGRRAAFAIGSAHLRSLTAA
ncbi:MAG TPA: hypothetical protein VLT89_08880 [Usitatibacter sp.]|nr:hypothetical protein [Usitatibacter sp.]